MRYHPVSTRVNAVRNDDASLIAPLEDVAAAPAGVPAAPAPGDPPAKPRQSALF
jgi:hypothetical protein